MKKNFKRTRHIFLTGKKQVGKSTLLKKVLNTYNGNLGGFYTLRTKAFLSDTYSVHLFDAGEEARPNTDNLLFICGQVDRDTAKRFNFLGTRALAKNPKPDLYLMDELGPHEAEATTFRREVLKLLDGDIPVLGMLQAPADLYWKAIVIHPQVRVLEITEDNREDPAIFKQILDLVHRT